MGEAMKVFQNVDNIPFKTVQSKTVILRMEFGLEKEISTVREIELSNKTDFEPLALFQSLEILLGKSGTDLNSEVDSMLVVESIMGGWTWPWNSMLEKCTLLKWDAHLVVENRQEYKISITIMPDDPPMKNNTDAE